MFIRIDSSTGVPLWQQIVQQVTRQAMAGTFGAGERLPTVRELAADLRINPNTVARAYQDLERDGIVETKRGLGTFACNLALSQPPEGRMRLLEARIDELLCEAANLQIGHDEIAELFYQRVQLLLPGVEVAVSVERTLVEKVGI